MRDDVTGFDMAAELLPGELRSAARGLPEAHRTRAEEIRLRVGRTAAVLMPDGERPLFAGYRVTGRDLAAVLEIATGASAHTAAESIRRGFVTVRGGCRIGLCGAAITGRGGIEGIRSVSSIAIRIPRQMRNCADGVFQKLTDSGFVSTLIVSPPGFGKTTLLRELVRRLSDGGQRVSLADERGEVAAVWEGVPQFDVGERTDVLSGASKAESAMLLLRAMNPEIIALDEITAPEDAEAIECAGNCGVSLLATAHAGDVSELTSRELYRKLLEKGIFKRAVVIRRVGRERGYAVERLQEDEGWSRF